MSSSSKAFHALKLINCQKGFLHSDRRVEANIFVTPQLKINLFGGLKFISFIFFGGDPTNYFYRFCFSSFLPSTVAGMAFMGGGAEVNGTASVDRFITEKILIFKIFLCNFKSDLLVPKYKCKKL